MIEKSDSVSWTLDITESSDGVSICNKTPSPLSRRPSSNGTLVARQNSLRLTSQRKTNPGYGRARSNSASTADSKTSRTSTTGGDIQTDEAEWSPSSNSTPLKNVRQNATGTEQAWVGLYYMYCFFSRFLFAQLFCSLLRLFFFSFNTIP